MAVMTLHGSLCDNSIYDPLVLSHAVLQPTTPAACAASAARPALHSRNRMSTGGGAELIWDWIDKGGRSPKSSLAARDKRSSHALPARSGGDWFCCPDGGRSISGPIIASTPRCNRKKACERSCSSEGRAAGSTTSSFATRSHASGPSTTSLAPGIR
ncbi:hypothetical protein Vafri_7429 [Volvox africanus]|uniref:Uncharacterized protein n=1 Tax=Volvox africanus TaxID=51714 RepID=A0A8J4F0N8_9CHLO|nr:hypothetical protein Vafri_7429 [Volvox africanus]